MDASKSPPAAQVSGGATGPAKKPGLLGLLKEGKGWFLTAFLVFLLLVLGVVLYLLKYRPMEFFYVLF